MNDFSVKVVETLVQIPYGRVTTYGVVATLAGNPSGARQVVRVLHSCSEKYNIPWHRVVNRKGAIPPRSSMRHLDQRILLESEGVGFLETGVVDLDGFFWLP